MTDNDRIIVRALAAADTLRFPVRVWEGAHSANRTAGLAMLSTHGTPLRMGGEEVARKAGERQLATAAEAGLVEVVRYGRVKFPHVRLTPTGEARARALAGLPGRDVGRMLLVEIGRRSSRKPKTLDRLWVDEIDLNKGKGWGLDAPPEERRALVEIEIESLAAVSEGWLEARSTVVGHVRYRVLAAGWSEIDTPSTPPDVGPLPDRDDELEKLFWSEYRVRLRELVDAAPNPPGELGQIPLPVAHVGCPIAG